MLSQSLVAVRYRLLRAPRAARCTCIAARSILSNINTIPAQSRHFQVSKFRAFSTIDSPKDEDDNKDEDLSLEDEEQDQTNGEMSPLERLLRHSQQFRLDMELDDDGDDGAGNDSEGGEGLNVSSRQQESRSFKSKSQSFSPGAFKRNTSRRPENSVNHSALGRRAEGHLIYKDMDEIDYEAELENVWDEEELKKRKFHQALRREQDKDHVCTNCGERGHRSRNCLIPRICPNCGNMGHTARWCKYSRTPDSIDEFLMENEEIQKKKKKSQKLKKKAAKAAKNPFLPRPKEVPTSDFNKRNESLRKELDDELDAYADMLEKKSRKRKEQKAQKEEEENSTSTFEH